MADINNARRLLAQGDQEGAVNELVNVLHRNSKHIEAWLMLADLLEDPHERKDCYKQILKADPNNQEALLQLRLLGGTAELRLNRPEGRRFDRESAPAQLEEPVEPHPERPEFRPDPPPDAADLPLEMRLRSELPANFILEPEPEPEEEPVEDSTRRLLQAREALKTYPGKAAPVVGKTLGRTWKLMRTSKLVRVVFIILGVAMAATIFLTVWASTIPYSPPANLIVGPGKKYLPALADLPQGWTADTADSQLISLAKMAEGYRMVYSNAGNEALQRETGVTYEVQIFSDSVDAEVALMSAANPGSYKVEGNVMKEEVISPTKLARVDSARLLFGQGFDPNGRPALSYTLLIREVNLFARVMVSAAMDDTQSQLAQNMKGALYQSAFYYASLLTKKLPLKADDRVVVETPFFPTPLPPAATPTLRVTVPPSNEALFSDRFEDPAASQAQWQLVSGAWTFDNGRMSCRAAPVGCEALIGTQNWQNYTFSVTVNGIEGVDKLIFLGVVEGKKTYVIKMRTDPANELVFVEQKAGKADRVIKKVPFKNYNRVPYGVEITVVGKNLKLTVDALKVLDVTDNLSDLTGQVGVGLLPAAEEGAPVASISFDNVQVAPMK